MLLHDEHTRRDPADGELLMPLHAGLLALHRPPALEGGQKRGERVGRGLGVNLHRSLARRVAADPAEDLQAERVISDPARQAVVRRVRLQARAHGARCV